MNEYRLKQKDFRERIKKVADKCFWKLHCTVVTAQSLTNKLKHKFCLQEWPINEVSIAGQHYFTCLIRWSTG